MKEWIQKYDFSIPGKNHADIWLVSLDLKTDLIELLNSILSDEEIIRRNRLYSTELRDRFSAARGQLKIILSQYLQIEPGKLKFKTNEHGKPFLAGSQLTHLHFNLSHSRDLALIGVSRDFEIGVDIEYHRPDWSGTHIAHRFFSPEEVTALEYLPRGKQHQAFFDCWTRKEAYIKARGKGLAIPLSGFTVTLSPDSPAALISTKHDPTAAKEWSIKNIVVPTEYSGAVCAHAVTWNCSRFDGRDGRIVHLINKARDK